MRPVWVDAGPSGDDEPPRCSAKGCRQAATVDLTWRNPAIHDGERTKHWLACAEHEAQLSSFLARRGFLIGTGPIA